MLAIARANSLSVSRSSGAESTRSEIAPSTYALVAESWFAVGFARPETLYPPAARSLPSVLLEIV